MCNVTTLYFVKSITIDKFVIFLIKVTIIFSLIAKLFSVLSSNG